MMALLRRLVAVILGSAVVARCIRAGLGRRQRPAPAPPTTPPSRSAPSSVAGNGVEPEPAAAPEAAPETTTEPEPEPEATTHPEPEREAEAAPELAAATWCEPVDGQCPPGFPVKVKLSSGIFHEPGGAHHPRVRPDRCYTNAAAAEADGYRRSKT